jgi:radical SAM-linked protein
VHYRIFFHKMTAMRYTGHLDLHKTWERTFRRAGLPLAYTQGFHPQPRLNLACALPLGFTSQAEILDAWLEQPLPIDEITPALLPALPPGIRITNIQEITERQPALQVQVQSAVYEITLLEPVPDLADRLQALLVAPSLRRQRRGKPYDLRPLIEAIDIMPPADDGLPCLQAQLSAREGATGRPEELLDAIGILPETARVHRTQLILSTPLPQTDE